MYRSSEVNYNTNFTLVYSTGAKSSIQYHILNENSARLGSITK